MAKPSPPLSTTTEVITVCRTSAPKLFAPKMSAYLSIVKSAAIWYLRREDLSVLFFPGVVYGLNDGTKYKQPYVR